MGSIRLFHFKTFIETVKRQRIGISFIGRIPDDIFYIFCSKHTDDNFSSVQVERKEFENFRRYLPKVQTKRQRFRRVQNFGIDREKRHV